MAKTTKEVPTDFDEKAATAAMRSRVGYFKEQADSLTLGGVRRVLEKDLGLEEYALDAHKRFIKQCLNECFEAATNENVSKSSGETGEEVVNSAKEETVVLSEKSPPDQELKQLEGKEKMHASPVRGLLAGADTSPKDSEEIDGVPSLEALSEDTITKAIRKRAAYFRANSETISLVGARRLLEEDLTLDKYALDSYRELITVQLDKVLQSSAVAKSTNGVKNNKRKKISSEDSSESLDGTDDIEEEEARPKKKIASKQKTQNSEGQKIRKGLGKEIKNRKGLGKETMKSSKKRPVESMSEESGDAEDGGDPEDDARSQSSVEEPVKRKSEAPIQAYGKHVEHLKSLIKSCGMSIPPSVYKRAKQAPESKREACLIKELEEMLKKEGLSTHPSEKEIKEVRKRKERTKELEGIDLSNIVASSRRRSSSSFLPPPKPDVSVGSDDDGEDDDEDDDDNEDDSDDGIEEEGAGDSNSEEINEDVEDESD